MINLKELPLINNYRYNDEFDFDIDFDKLPHHSLKVLFSTVTHRH